MNLAAREMLKLAAKGGREAWQALARLEARIERRLDRFVDTGWRRLFGWLGLVVAGFSYIYAPLHGVSVDYNAVNVFLTFATGMYITRGVEKHLRDRLGLPNAPPTPQGGLVNNAAIT